MRVGEPGWGGRDAGEVDRGQVVIQETGVGPGDFILSVGKHVRREVTGPDVHFQWDCSKYCVKFNGAKKEDCTCA